MILSDTILEELRIQALAAAKKAGKHIEENAGRVIEVKNKEGGDSLASQVFTEVDVKCQEIIIELIQPTLAKYDLGLLAEESEDDRSRLQKDYFWSIDPLDGTLPFTEGVPGYAVSVGLVAKDGYSVLGVVYDPVEQRSYSAIKGKGLWINDTPYEATVNTDGYLYFNSDRSFTQTQIYPKVVTSLEDYCKKNGLKGVKTSGKAGAVMHALWLLDKGVGCYYKFPKKVDGGGSIWDYAASSCIMLEAGFIVTNIFGEELFLNDPETSFMNRQSVMVTRDKKLHAFLVELYKELAD